jgi:integrase
MRRLRDAGERSPEYLAELERWCAPGGHLAAYWSQRSVHAITYAELQEWSAWMAEVRGIGPKTRHNVMAAMSSFLGWLRKTGEITVCPPIPWPRVREHSPTLLSASAQAQVLAAIPEPARGIYLALALLGLRPSEAIRARAADYAPGDPGWLTVPRAKNGESKRLPVPADLAAWLEANVPREARLAAAPLFLPPYRGRGRRPQRWGKKQLRVVWQRACAAVGVRAKLYEGTKHSRATDLLLQGVPERVLQALLGHRDARSTRRYARLADSALVDVIRRPKP